MIAQQLKLWLVLALIFLLGVATGVSLTIGMSPRFRHSPGAQQMKARMLMSLTRRLNLTPDQQTRIQPILADIAMQMQAVHREEVGRISQIMEKADSQMASILTPEQQTELQRMQKEMESERDRMAPGHMHPWGGPGGPHGGPGGMMPPFPPQGASQSQIIPPSLPANPSPTPVPSPTSVD